MGSSSIPFDVDPKQALEDIVGTRYPIKHWSYSSLITYLRNPLAWYKRYVEGVQDIPSNPAGVIGRAGHVALQHFYTGIPKEAAIVLGLEYLRSVPDFEINFGKARSDAEKIEKRIKMEKEYDQAIQFYLEKPPLYTVLGAEVSGYGSVPGLSLPIKAISDLVVESRDKKSVDIVDHKFVDSFSYLGASKTLYVVQAIFNYYTVREKFGREVRRFILQECKKRKNKDGAPQMRQYVIDFAKSKEEFAVFHRLLRDVTEEIATRRVYLPNPSDMFEGENSFDIYRLGLIDNGPTMSFEE